MKFRGENVSEIISVTQYKLPILNKEYHPLD
jgi:hypothetical protein